MNLFIFKDRRFVVGFSNCEIILLTFGMIIHEKGVP